jgi:hypothetical protein
MLSEMEINSWAVYMLTSSALTISLYRLRKSIKAIFIPEEEESNCNDKSPLEAPADSIFNTVELSLLKDFLAFFARGIFSRCGKITSILPVSDYGSASKIVWFPSK